MKQFFEEVELTLTPLASSFTPEGSSTNAVIHQWMYSIAFDLPLFGTLDDKSNASLKKSLIDTLTDQDLFIDTASFKRLLVKDLKIKPQENPEFTFIDLFAGIGGMRLGFQNNGGLCVFSSEFEKNAQETYLRNHGELPFGDITKINPEDIPEHDILLAGFPCQPFSHAGLKLGIDDTRGTLFHDIAQILDKKRPKFALLENVKGLVSHEKGATLRTILRTLTQIGYSCNISKDLIQNGSVKEIQTEAKKMILKSIDFGVPQNRQRIYIVLWLDGIIKNFSYPEPTVTETKVGDILDDKPDPKLIISDRLWEGHQRRKIQNKINGKGFGYGSVNDESAYTNTISARYYKDGSEILIERKDPDTGEDLNPRKLSTKEAAKLQGFPDEFLISQSNTQAYKQFGNSVSVPVIEAVAKEIKNHLN